jgi:hypothetical protein
VTVWWFLHHPIQYIKNCWVRLLSNYNIKYIFTIYTRLDTCLMSISRFSLRDKVESILYKHLSKWQPYNISVPMDLKVTCDTRLILNIIYVWKLNQTVLELDFWAVKLLFFPRRDLNSHHWSTAAPIT